MYCLDFRGGGFVSGSVEGSVFEARQAFDICGDPWLVEADEVVRTLSLTLMLPIPMRQCQCPMVRQPLPGNITFTNQSPDSCTW